MIRRKRRSSSQRDALAYKQSAAVGIGESLEDQRAREATEEARVIVEVRIYIWLTRFCCQLCGGGRTAECDGFPDEMHEEPPRSLTRGRPLTERFNLLVCGRLCKACHRDVTEHRIAIVFTNPALGFLAPVYAEPRH